MEHIRCEILRRCRRALLFSALVVVALAPSGCAEDLSLRLGPDAGNALDGLVTIEHVGDGSSQVRLDCKSEARWVHFDLSTGRSFITEDGDAAGSEGAWDLAFQRFNIKLNGGVSGEGGVEVAWMDEVDFAEVAAIADNMVFATDSEDSDGDGISEYVMSIGDNRWYSYNVMSHVLTPKEIVYLVKGHSGDYFKFAMIEYYDDAGTAGYPKFRWAPLQR